MGTFCPYSFDDVEMGDQQANVKKANVISTFWVVILVQKIKQGAGGLRFQVDFFLACMWKLLFPDEIKNPKQGETHHFMYKQSMVQMELLFINICSKSPKKKKLWIKTTSQHHQNWNIMPLNSHIWGFYSKRIYDHGNKSEGSRVTFHRQRRHFSKHVHKSRWTLSHTVN